jgi:hypothetical protein
MAAQAFEIKINVNKLAFPRLRSCAQAFSITAHDFEGQILSLFGALHRRQEKEIFKTEGAASGAKWAALDPKYAARKKAITAAAGQVKRQVKAAGLKVPKLFPRGAKILVLSGDMKERFVNSGRPEYIQEALVGKTSVLYRFGAESEIAGYHVEGNPNLPVRDMVRKSPEQVAEFRATLLDWYVNKRIPQALKACRVALRAVRRPR